jgi:hypothetical protein
MAAASIVRVAITSVRLVNTTANVAVLAGLVLVAEPKDMDVPGHQGID